MSSSSLRSGPLRFLILNTDYPEFLKDLYTAHSDLASASYAEQVRVRAESSFGVADFYSHNLRALGHEAWDIHVNNEHSQRAWAREHGLPLPGPEATWNFRLRRGLIPWLSRATTASWYYDVLAAQIEHYRPDIILNQAMIEIRPDFFARHKSHAHLLVGQHAPVPPKTTAGWEVYDLIISSLPPILEWFQARGNRVALHRLAFEPRVLGRVNTPDRDLAVSFVGSFHPVHRPRTELLEQVTESLPLRTWGPAPPDATRFPRLRGT